MSQIDEQGANARWNRSQTGLLRQAYDKAASEWPKTILNNFLELGGGSNLCWSADNIEMKLIEMGLDTFWSETVPSARPRKRVRLSSGLGITAGVATRAEGQQDESTKSGPTGLTDEQKDCILEQIERNGLVDLDAEDEVCATEY
jgi:hypothetical protein